MKILKLFNFKKSDTSNSKFESLNKSQLSKVIGGVELKSSPDLHTAAHEAAHVVQQSK